MECGAQNHRFWYDQTRNRSKVVPNVENRQKGSNECLTFVDIKGELRSKIETYRKHDLKPTLQWCSHSIPIACLKLCDGNFSQMSTRRPVHCSQRRGRCRMEDVQCWPNASAFLGEAWYSFWGDLWWPPNRKPNCYCNLLMFLFLEVTSLKQGLFEPQVHKFGINLDCMSKFGMMVRLCCKQLPVGNKLITESGWHS